MARRRRCAPRRAVHATVALAVGVGVLATVGAPTPVRAAEGTVTGTVFRDFNHNGVMDRPAPGDPVPVSTAIDVPVEGVGVAVYDASGTELVTGSTNSAGTYELAYSTGDASTNVRVEFTVPEGWASTSASSGPGVRNGTTVQFVAAGGTADLGIARVGDYSKDNPELAVPVPRAVFADGAANPRPLTDLGVATLYTVDYATAGRPSIGTAPGDLRPQATLAETGSIWGVAPYGDGYVFSAALFKRHAATGPGGLGAIYVTQVVPAGQPDVANTSVFATIPNTGTNPRTGTGDPISDASATYDWFHDVAAFREVSKIGLGDIDITPDLSALYAVNLFNRQLYRVPVVAPTAVGGAPTAGDPSAWQSFAIPTPADCTMDARPFGIHVDTTSVWVGVTCPGPTVAAMTFSVYRFDQAAGSFGPEPVAPVFQTPVPPEPRGIAYFDAPANWRPWDDAFGTVSTEPTIVVDPQPLLSDIDFDANGDMTLAIKDRSGDQLGNFAGSTTPADTVSYVGYGAGGVLRACRDATAGWVLESNGSCGGRTGWEEGNGMGPGGGEFYETTYRAPPGSHDRHDQTALGATEQVPGFANIVATGYNPLHSTLTGGYNKLANGGDETGARIDGTEVAAAPDEGDPLAEGTFGKTSGLGDIDALVGIAPVELGNRTWFDVDGDGIQDAGEPPIPGIRVTLTDADGRPVTDADGRPVEPLFTDEAGRYAFRNLVPDRTYRVVFDRSSADVSGLAAFGIDSPDDLAPTAGPGEERRPGIDSNPDPSTGVAVVTLGGPGRNDHTIDAGFVAGPPDPEPSTTTTGATTTPPTGPTAAPTTSPATARPVAPPTVDGPGPAPGAGPLPATGGRGLGRWLGGGLLLVGVGLLLLRLGARRRGLPPGARS